MKAYGYWVTCVAVAFLFTAVGCEGPSKRLNVPPQGLTAEPSALQGFFTPAVDNAMLHDMCVADIHFVPHTAEINGLGEWRLEDYCRLLKDRGGIIHLETASTDDELNEARIQSVHDFFASAGLGGANVTVKLGLPRGRPLDGVDAIRIKQEGTADDYETDSSDDGS